MTGLIRAEVLRLRTIRTFWLLGAGALAVIWAGVLATALTGSLTPGTSAARVILALAGIAQTCALLAGTLSVTTEFRHQTVTGTFLISPRRGRVLAAKLITLTGAGLIFGLIATGSAAAIALPVLASRQIPAGISGGQLAGIIAGGGVATALGAALGVGAGALLRSQVITVVAVLAVLYVAEPLVGFVPGVGPAVQRYGLGGLASGATATAGYSAGTRLLGQLPAAALLAGYALVLVLAGTAQLVSRDVTA
jgi:hypothetical protein